MTASPDPSRATNGSTPEASARFHQSDRPRIREPRRTNPLRYLSVALSRAVAELVAGLDLKDDARVLDFGCADAQYRHLLPAGCAYQGADLPGNPGAAIEISAAGTIPVEDGSFDAVLSTQVLEHVPDPGLYLAECFRVLRPGGVLLLSTHGMMVLHPDPVDYWRWTSQGLRHIVERAGFEVRRFEGIVGMAAMGLQTFQDATLAYVPHRFRLRALYIVVMQALIGLCDRLSTVESRAHNAFVFAVIARRPAASVHTA